MEQGTYFQRISSNHGAVYDATAAASSTITALEVPLPQRLIHRNSSGSGNRRALHEQNGDEHTIHYLRENSKDGVRNHVGVGGRIHVFQNNGHEDGHFCTMKKHPMKGKHLPFNLDGDRKFQTKMNCNGSRLAVVGFVSFLLIQVYMLCINYSVMMTATPESHVLLGATKAGTWECALVALKFPTPFVQRHGPFVPK